LSVTFKNGIGIYIIVPLSSTCLKYVAALRCEIRMLICATLKRSYSIHKWRYVLLHLPTQISSHCYSLCSKCPTRTARHACLDVCTPLQSVICRRHVSYSQCCAKSQMFSRR